MLQESTLVTRALIALAAVACAAVIAGGAAAQHVAPGPGGWSREGAATYLDDRMDVWFTTVTKLRTGQGEAACVSCHTVVPYALARPALRRAMHVRPPTPQEARLLDGVMRRVGTYDAHQPYYDFNDRKKVESRGTEAVLNALILAAAGAERDGGEPSEPTRRAFQRLWETQRPDGAWDWLDFGLEPLESTGATYYGATLAALAVGTAAGSSSTASAAAAEGTRRLRAHLTEHYAAQNRFNQVWALLASTRWPDVLARAVRDALIADLRAVQGDDGGWSLSGMGGWRWNKPAWRAWPPGTPDPALLAGSDAFATALIVYTLRSAGVPAADPAVAGGVRWLKAHQQPVHIGERVYAAWRSHSLNHDREHGGPRGEPWRRFFMSDAATSFAALALLASE